MMNDELRKEERKPNTGSLVLACHDCPGQAGDTVIVTTRGSDLRGLPGLIAICRNKERRMSTAAEWHALGNPTRGAEMAETAAQWKRWADALEQLLKPEAEGGTLKDE